jgi:hypothetical protein
MRYVILLLVQVNTFSSWNVIRNGKNSNPLLQQTSLDCSHLHSTHVSVLPTCKNQIFASLKPEKPILVITQSPHSSDLVPSDFGLFPSLRMGLKGTRFATLGDIKPNVAAELRKIPTSAGSMEQVCARVRALP